MTPLPRPYPRLYAIVDADLAGRCGWTARDLARAFLAGGATLLQLRAKSLGGGAFRDLAAEVAEDAAAAGAALIVNDRADVAVLANTAGVHVGQDDLSPEDVRRVVGPEAVIGFSTHSTSQIADALTRPIDYLAVGPVFWTQTKDTGYERVGIPLVEDAAREARRRMLPVVAIGGITLETARSVIEAGAQSVAVVSDLLQGNPEERVRRYLSWLS